MSGQRNSKRFLSYSSEEDTNTPIRKPTKQQKAESEKTPDLSESVCEYIGMDSDAVDIESMEQLVAEEFVSS